MRPAGVSRLIGEPTVRWWCSRSCCRRSRRRVPSVAIDAVGARLPVEAGGAWRVRGRGRRPRASGRMRGPVRRARRRRRWRPRPCVSPCAEATEVGVKPLTERQDVVAAELVADRADDRLFEPLAEHGEGADEREPDHQRGGGGGGAGGVARRVRAGEPAGGAADAWSRASRARARAAERWSVATIATPRKTASTPTPSSSRRGPVGEAGGERADADQRDRDGTDDERDCGAEACEA